MSNLSPKDKLNALGVKAPAVQNNPYLSEFEAIENYGFGQFQTDVSGQADYAAFETYLVDTIGLASTEATQFRNRMEQKYTDFSDFQTTLSGFSDIDEWINSFSWGTTIAGETTDEGDASGGIRVHSEAGVTYDGVNVPPGTVEIFGPEIHTSETGQASTTSPTFTTTNLTVTDATPDLYEEITYSADVSHDGSSDETVTMKLTEDGSVVASKTLVVPASTTKTVDFKRTYTELLSFEAKINEAGPLTISVVPSGLIEPEDL